MRSRSLTQCFEYSQFQNDWSGASIDGGCLLLLNTTTRMPPQVWHVQESVVYGKVQSQRPAQVQNELELNKVDIPDHLTKLGGLTVRG